MTKIDELLAVPVEGPLSQGDAALLIRYRDAVRELADNAEKSERTHRMEIARLDLALAKERAELARVRNHAAKTFTEYREQIIQYQPVQSVIGDWDWPALVNDSVPDAAADAAFKALAYIAREQAKERRNG